MYIYIYIYRERERGIDIILIKLSRLENPANTHMWHTEHWIAVSILLGLINSACIISTTQGDRVLGKVKTYFQDIYDHAVVHSYHD